MAHHKRVELRSTCPSAIVVGSLEQVKQYLTMAFVQTFKAECIRQLITISVVDLLVISTRKQHKYSGAKLPICSVPDFTCLETVLDALSLAIILPTPQRAL